MQSILFLPLGLLPHILPTIISCNRPLIMCPIHLFLALVILLKSSLFSSPIISTSSFVFLSTQLTFSILLQTHISNASKSAHELTVAKILQNNSGIELTVAQIKISNCCKSWAGLFTVRIPSERISRWKWHVLFQWRS